MFGQNLKYVLALTALAIMTYMLPDVRSAMAVSNAFDSSSVSANVLSAAVIEANITKPTRDADHMRSRCPEGYACAPITYVRGCPEGYVCTALTGSTTRSITVTSPTAGQTFKEGQTVSVTWNTKGISDSQRLDISLNVPLNSGSVGQLIAHNIQNTGSYSWRAKTPEPFYASEANKTAYPTGTYTISVICPIAHDHCNFSPNFGESASFNIATSSHEVVKGEVKILVLNGKALCIKAPCEIPIAKSKVVVYDEQNTILFTQYTDDGKTIFHNLSQGSYTARVTSEGYQDGTVSFKIPSTSNEPIKISLNGVVATSGAIVITNVNVNKGNVVVGSNSGLWSMAYPSISLTMTNTGNEPLYISKDSALALAFTTSSGLATSTTITSVNVTGSTTGDTTGAYIVNTSRTFTYNFATSNVTSTSAPQKIAITKINYSTSIQATGMSASEGLSNAFVVVP